MESSSGRMTNEQVADVFLTIANLLDIKGEIVYKTLAYRRVSENLRVFPEDINVVFKENRLAEVPGVGKAISEKITELLETGRLGFLERLKEEVPLSLIDLLQVSDVGPRKAALFWKQAGVTNLTELEAAARAGKLRVLPGMGEKSEARILAGIEALGRRSQRMLLGTAWPIARRWLDWLRQQPGVQRAEAAGSLRRWRSTIGDLDLVAASDHPAEVMDAFIHHPEVMRVLGQGEDKSSIELGNGLKLQLWIQPPQRFGTLWVYATGSKDHNVRIRELAQKKGLSLSEQALVDGQGEETLYDSEEKVYTALGFPWIPPELREDRGEVQAAKAGQLPVLLELADIHAELHAHSTWSDGAETIEGMAQAARERGYKVLAITDHSGGLGIANGLSVERLRQRKDAIQAAQEKLGDSIRLLHGTEVDILADGNIYYPDEVLAELDIVIASLHASLRQPRDVITARLLKAIHNPHVDIIGHPSGRLLPDREGADLEWDAVLAGAKESGVALEINADPVRLDLDEVYVRRAAEMGIVMSINTDAHSIESLEHMEYGVAVARRAWCGPGSVLNAWPAEKLLGWLRKRG